MRWETYKNQYEVYVCMYMPCGFVESHHPVLIAGTPRHVLNSIQEHPAVSSPFNGNPARKLTNIYSGV